MGVGVYSTRIVKRARNAEKRDSEVALRCFGAKRIEKPVRLGHRKISLPRSLEIRSLYSRNTISISCNFSLFLAFNYARVSSVDEQKRRRGERIEFA